MSCACRASYIDRYQHLSSVPPRQMLVAVQGINLSAVDGMGNTPLMDAIRHGHTEVQAALRAAGATLDSAQVADKLCLAAAENDLATLQVCPAGDMAAELS